MRLNFNVQHRNKSLFFDKTKGSNYSVCILKYLFLTNELETIAFYVINQTFACLNPIHSLKTDQLASGEQSSHPQSGSLTN